VALAEANRWLERYRALREANFRRLDLPGDDLKVSDQPPRSPTRLAEYFDISPGPRAEDRAAQCSRDRDVAQLRPACEHA
jgi:hypothetical protein